MVMVRRTFLKNTFTGSLLAGVVPSVLAGVRDRSCLASVPTASVVRVRTGTPADNIFSRGVAVATGNNSGHALTTLVLGPSELADTALLEELFMSLPGRTLFGLMENASFALFEAIARTHGARFLLVGQHSWGGGGPHDSRHHILTVPRSQGVGRVLAGALSAGNQGYAISESSLGAARTVPVRRQAPSQRADHWACVAGEALAAIGLGLWQPLQAGRFQREQANRRYGDSGSLVSFLIEA